MFQVLDEGPSPGGRRRRVRTVGISSGSALTSRRRSRDPAVVKSSSKTHNDHTPRIALHRNVTCSNYTCHVHTSILLAGYAIANWVTIEPELSLLNTLAAG